ncbi:MAG: N-acetylmuramoyl-L-alanine amidase family protein [Eubacteriales bacterium]|nr:N-acetylmuramoyl-L-alanine amidase family protein [Eubacteriales bacterium]
MKRNSKKIRVVLMLLMLLLCIGGTVSITSSSTKEVKAAVRNGFVTSGGKTYYYKNGVRFKGWLTLSGKKYYFSSSTGVMAKGWVKNSSGKYRYFSKSSGRMATGWLVDGSGNRRYFDPSSGIMQTGWFTSGNNKYFLNAKTGIAATGWVANASGGKRYFYSTTGIMAKGWVKNSKGKYRYFSTTSGIMVTGWVTNKNGTYYFDKASGIMATGTVKIDNKSYKFTDNGLLITGGSTPDVLAPSGSRTLKNYLAGALQPVGQALYVWGGGWNDSTRKGVSPTWKTWYDSQSASYDYNNYRDLSTTNRAKGLDCSGFVGWAAYQVMQTKSGVGGGYTVVSGEVGSSYNSRGWGVICTQTYLAGKNYKFLPGDVGYNSGHTWIVLGQCKDTSLVIIHSTPQAGCQIAGTPTKDGNYSSQAIELAKKYMSKYYGYTKYDYHTSSGHYIKNGSYFRWNRTTLADPDGYANMTADQILKDLFGF